MEVGEKEEKGYMYRMIASSPCTTARTSLTKKSVIATPVHQLLSPVSSSAE